PVPAARDLTARTALRGPTPRPAPPEPIGTRSLGPRQGRPVAQSRSERLREAAALQRSLRETHGDEAEEVLAEHIAQTSSGSVAQATFDAAIARNRRAGVRFQLLGGGCPGSCCTPRRRCTTSRSARTGRTGSRCCSSPTGACCTR